MELKIKRWLRALALAKLLFDDEGYFTTYLEEIEEYIRLTNGMEQIKTAVQRER